VTVVDGRSAADWLAMARLEERTQQGHGVPAPPRRFFLEVCRGLQEAGLVDLLLARIPDGRIAAGFVLFKGPREWIYALSASDPALVRELPRDACPAVAGLQRAAAAGVVFDLGRSAPEQTSLAEFKLRWGAEAVPSHMIIGRDGRRPHRIVSSEIAIKVEPRRGRPGATRTRAVRRTRAIAIVARAIVRPPASGQ